MSAPNINDGDRVSATGRLFLDGPYAYLLAPRPEDRQAGWSPDGAPETAIRLLNVDLVLQPQQGLPQWVRVVGRWEERRIEVELVEEIDPDLTLIDIPPHEISDVFGADIADRVNRHFGDRSRRWDLLFQARSSGERVGPVAIVSATRALPEMNDYLATLPPGAVIFRTWLSHAR